MSNLILILVGILVVVAALVVILNRKKVIVIKNKGVLRLLNIVLVSGIIYLLLAVFGGPIWEQISAYRERVLSESEEACKKENAPYWCNL